MIPHFDKDQPRCLCDYDLLHVWKLKYPPRCYDLLEYLQLGVEKPSLQESLDREVELGENLIRQLPYEFRSKNMGKFVAITYDGEILATCNSLDALHEELIRKNPRQNYYLARIGHDSIARIE